MIFQLRANKMNNDTGYYSRFIPDFVNRTTLREYTRPSTMNKMFCFEKGCKTMLPSSLIAKAEQNNWRLKYTLIPAKGTMAKSDKVKGYRPLDVLHLAFLKGYNAVEPKQNTKDDLNQSLSSAYSHLAELRSQIRHCEQQVRLVAGDFSDYGIVTKQPKFALLSQETLIQQAKSNLSICGIYFLIKDNEIVYIGQSTNIFARLSGHGNKDFDSVTFVPCEKSELNIMESLYILAYRPKLNGMAGRNQDRISSPLSLQQIIEKFKVEA